jgi:hypothetical protein
MATPRVSQNVTPLPAAPVITEPLPALPPTPLMTLLPVPLETEFPVPLPVLLPVPEDDEPPEPLGASPTFPTQAPNRVAAANKTMVQSFMVHTSTGWWCRRAEGEAVKQDSL